MALGGASSVDACGGRSDGQRTRLRGGQNRTQTSEHHQLLESITNYFLVSLAVADLCVSLVVMPFCIAQEFIGQ